MVANKIFNLQLDMSGQSIIPRISIRRNDFNTNVFSIQVTQNGVPFDFTNFNPIFECLTPAKTFIRDDGIQFGNIHIIDATQGKFEYTLINEIFSVLGNVDLAYFAFEQLGNNQQNQTNRVTTGNFFFSIIADALSGNIEQSSYMSDVESLLDLINQLKNDYQTLNLDNFVTSVQLNERAKIILSNIEPNEVDNNTFWYEDVGESPIDSNNGDGVMIANASASDTEPTDGSKIWLDTE